MPIVGLCGVTVFPLFASGLFLPRPFLVAVRTLVPSQAGSFPLLSHRTFFFFTPSAPITRTSGLCSLPASQTFLFLTYIFSISRSPVLRACYSYKISSMASLVQLSLYRLPWPRRVTFFQQRRFPRPFSYVRPPSPYLFLSFPSFIGQTNPRPWCCYPPSLPFR